MKFAAQLSQTLMVFGLERTAKVNDTNTLEGWLPNSTFIPEQSRHPSKKMFSAFRTALDSATSEQSMQSYLELNPKLLSLHIDGHEKWVVPRKRLGSEHVTDFMLASCSSLGMHWVAVELESPCKELFRKNGDPSAALTHAIRQVLDWRSWLGDNLSYARRQPSRHGLGLYNIRASIPAFIVIGRRAALDRRTNERRRQLSEELNIQIHTYDWLLYESNLDF